MILRQGDLTFIRIGDAPKRRKKPAVPAVPARLANGELSGHWHVAHNATVARERDGRYILTVPGPVPAIVRVEPDAHAHRHAPIELPPGRYEIPGVADGPSIHLGQREYVAGAVARAVAD